MYSSIEYRAAFSAYFTLLDLLTHLAIHARPPKLLDYVSPSIVSTGMDFIMSSLKNSSAKDQWWHNSASMNNESILN